MQTKTLTAFLLTIALLAAHAQSPWQGEWGAATATQSQRLEISDCHDLSCTFSLSIKEGTANRCETSTPAKLALSGDDATATLPGPDTAHACKLAFHRDGNHSTILVTSAGVACHSYYCTDPTYNKLSFDHTFALRSPQPWFGSHVEDCFYKISPARMATCTDAALAKLEEDWRQLYREAPLDGSPSAGGYEQSLSVDDSILNQCDTAASPSQCLRDRYTADITTLQARKSALTDASIERGDPATAHALAIKIAGRYRHRFANGDVQGDHFTSTNTMTLTPVGNASIRFDIELAFFNGHECNISGGALYRKDGTFVFDDDPKNAIPGEPVCRFALVPTANGVDFKDLGGCKMAYCGARGGLDGEGFRFSDRIP